jgi:Flp pilus assembly pilin Flp
MARAMGSSFGFDENGATANSYGVLSDDYKIVSGR